MVTNEVYHKFRVSIRLSDRSRRTKTLKTLKKEQNEITFSVSTMKRFNLLQDSIVALVVENAFTLVFYLAVNGTDGKISKLTGKLPVNANPLKKSN